MLRFAKLSSLTKFLDIGVLIYKNNKAIFI